MSQSQIESDHAFALALASAPEDDYGYEIAMFSNNSVARSPVRTASTDQYMPAAATSLHAESIFIDMSTIPGNRVNGADESNILPAGIAVPTGRSWLDDYSLARAMQMMENEIDEEMRRQEVRDEDFNGKEYQASKCKRQFLTFSTFIVLVQIIILIIMCVTDGMAPSAENPMMGPPATTLVIWGAKEGALIKYNNQWWRMFSPIFLHAGILHLLSNAFIQLRVGGYLNRVMGTIIWSVIYFLSGIFGNMCSCIFLPDTVGVGSSGALLGMLSSWIVWIIFRWEKIPSESRAQRNCQLGIVVTAVVVTLGTSFAKFVDFAAHFGGAIQGFLLGGLLLSHELDNEFTRKIVRVSCLLACSGLFIAAIYILAFNFHPSDQNLPYWETNDDWSKHGFR